MFCLILHQTFAKIIICLNFFFLLREISTMAKTGEMILKIKCLWLSLLHGRKYDVKNHIFFHNCKASAKYSLKKQQKIGLYV